ncbi:nucleotidyltransferase family protein [Marinobacter halotolerans]|uniref:nucleotidyltransferase family protein n=1 Tax=Marinobacter halotolerans TaxID=1569211 RepID=UPI001248CFF2|nr:nucleotidyltransferase family protein [Marinobacter halotolerans]
MPQNPDFDHEAFPVLVLAAGASRRMGRPKALLPMGEGTMLDRAIVQGRQLGKRVTVITGGGYPLVRYRCRQQAWRWHYARDWSQGMSASLKAGIASLGAGARGVFVVLLDQPLIERSDLAHLAMAARQWPDTPIAAEIHGRPAAPAYIPRSLWRDIGLLEGDRGAASILAWHGAITLPIGGVLSDVDTIDDWRRVSRNYTERFDKLAE